MKIIARHLTADLFSCQDSKLYDMESLCRHLQKMVEAIDFHLLKSETVNIEDGHFLIFLALREGHCAVHVYLDKRYVACDVFLGVAEKEPTPLLKALKDYLKPEKFRTTFLKRGDIAAPKDLKPKVKTQIAPLRRTINTGAKVIRLLAQRRRK
ncbi:hypothetical protein TAMA11512_14140 [Selenomonas sp. TAMA-11512]|uniref:S-adenosylmethionine decarboxylase family protein n=1 Tax=Selenomonas sp. TAMA-11512 TaxID=3095337 RepID=UPI0030895EC6|nr:hypothetical protein TAMA11512_14140 [Selenomonas sp. TAMA-11512]